MPYVLGGYHKNLYKAHRSSSRIHNKSYIIEVDMLARHFYNNYNYSVLIPWMTMKFY